jgi:D-aspartate oxidase
MPLKSSKPQIVVVGAGIVGLSTAVCLQETLQSIDVTIVADKLLQETLSFGAGGLFRPEANIGASKEGIKEWAKNSYDRFLELVMSSEAGESGMQLVSGYHMSSYSRESLNNEILAELIPDFRDFNENERRLFPNRFKHGVFWTTIITDPRYYMPWLTNRFNTNGGRIVNKHLESLQELENYDVIVNCSGLNAKTLVNDWKITAVRGQTVKVKAPWIKHFYFADDAYVIPGRDYVTLGGIKEYGDFNTNLKEYDRQSIWQRCTEVVPSLQKAEVVFEWVGLRPQRQPVRVETELMRNQRNHASSDLKVVHNYGHGGHGITLSWGTAKHATNLVKQLLIDESSSQISSKL